MSVLRVKQMTDRVSITSMAEIVDADTSNDVLFTVEVVDKGAFDETMRRLAKRRPKAPTCNCRGLHARYRKATAAFAQQVQDAVASMTEEGIVK